MTRRLAWILATGGGSGKFPVAPGTAGSFVALVIYWFILPDSSEGAFPLAVYSVVSALVFTAGCWAAGVLEKILGRDHGSIVIDEFVGQWLALIALPKSIPLAIAAFFLFRLFDIWKPFPVRKMESIPGGLGVMADDLIAGVYSNILLRVLVWTGVPLIVG
ncbi:phosphatidylglycerophosphatase A [candidate division KSB1 bacterium]